MNKSVASCDGLCPLVHHALHGIRICLAHFLGSHRVQLLHQTNGATGALTSAFEKTIVDCCCRFWTGGHFRQAFHGGVARAEQVRAGLNFTGARHADVGAVRHAHLTHPARVTSESLVHAHVAVGLAKGGKSENN